LFFEFTRAKKKPKESPLENIFKKKGIARKKIGGPLLVHPGA
jgi:hypothetical protein